MTDWKALAKAVILANGEITATNTAIVKREILADGKVSREEAEFLLDLLRSANHAYEGYRRFVFDIIKRVVLPDGHISSGEAAWLIKMVFADGQVDAAEKSFLKELKESALVTCPEFDELCHQYESV